MIDAIIMEHSNTLETVIHNLSGSHPGLAESRRLSQDLVQRCQGSASCLPCPYVSLKAAEKLNVQSTGQLGPNIKDPPAMLREVTQLVPDLIGLVESTTDGLGVGSQDKPDEHNQAQFEKASVEEEEPSNIGYRFESSISSPSSNSVEIQMACPEEQPSEDQWINETHRELTELSEARSQLMDELNAISEDV